MLVAETSSSIACSGDDVRAFKLNFDVHVLLFCSSYLAARLVYDEPAEERFIKDRSSFPYDGKYHQNYLLSLQNPRNRGLRGFSNL